MSRRAGLPRNSRRTLPDDQQAMAERNARGRDTANTRRARGAVHRIRIRGLFGLSCLEIQSENSFLIFAIVLLVVFCILAAIYMLKTL